VANEHAGRLELGNGSGFVQGGNTDRPGQGVIGDDGMTGNQNPVLAIDQGGVDEVARTPTATSVPSVAAGSICLTLAVVASMPTTVPSTRFWPAATVTWSRE
jgi:hypothetical protein